MLPHQNSWVSSCMDRLNIISLANVSLFFNFSLVEQQKGGINENQSKVLQKIVSI